MGRGATDRFDCRRNSGVTSEGRNSGRQGFRVDWILDPYRTSKAELLRQNYANLVTWFHPVSIPVWCPLEAGDHGTHQYELKERNAQLRSVDAAPYLE
jgi:hypothetical protein